MHGRRPESPSNPWAIRRRSIQGLWLWPPRAANADARMCVLHEEPKAVEDVFRTKVFAPSGEAPTHCAGWVRRKARALLPNRNGASMAE